jgi:hypothetical protein
VEKIGDIEIRVIGKLGNLELKPDNYDIRHIVSIFIYILSESCKKGRCGLAIAREDKRW